MFIGHYGACFVLKRLEPRVPLWVLFLAVQLVDIAWGPLIFAGVERAEVTTAYRGSLPLELVYMPYTHSLVAALVWTAAAFAATRYFARGIGPPTRIGLVVAVAVLSHWLLDFVVHRPDLPLYDDAHKVGLALWNWPLAALALETVCYFGAWWVYCRTTPPPEPRARRGFLLLGVAVLAVQVVVFYVPTLLPSIEFAAGLFFLTYLQLAWLARWIEKPGAAADRPPAVSERI